MITLANRHTAVELAGLEVLHGVIYTYGLP
jgi:hypothetical protein